MNRQIVVEGEHEDIPIKTAEHEGRLLDTVGQLRDVEILYSRGTWSKGEAWNHLLANPPTVFFQGRSYTPLFKEVTNYQGQAHKTNPYRKAHGCERFWGWIVAQWREGSGRVRAPKVPKVRRSRYALLSEGFLDDP